jgi:DUF1680 family protein
MGVRDVDATLIPYLVWSNREPGAMRVWIPLGEPGSADAVEPA